MILRQRPVSTLYDKSFTLMVSKTVKRAEKYFRHKFVGQYYVGQKWRSKRIVLYLIILDLNLLPILVLDKCVVGRKTYLLHTVLLDTNVLA